MSHSKTDNTGLSLPFYTYVLRRWLEEPNELPCYESAVIVTSDKALDPDVLLQRVSEMVARPKEFVLVSMPPNSTGVLSTFHRTIDSEIPAEEKHGPREFTGWWSHAELRDIRDEAVI